MANREWAEKIINKLDSSYKHRWEVYENNLRNYLNKNVTWLDLGCGNNVDVEEKRNLVAFASGVDIYKNKNLAAKPFVISDISKLPFKSESVDVISLRFVIEHIENPPELFNELNRVMRPNGIVVIITTNVWSPVIFLPKLFPYSLRKKTMLKLFDVEDDDIFPTFHRFNSYMKTRSVGNILKLEKIEFIQDLNSNNKIVFIIFFIWHILTKIKFLKIFRSNILTVYKKEITTHNI